MNNRTTVAVPTDNDADVPTKVANILEAHNAEYNSVDLVYLTNAIRENKISTEELDKLVKKFANEQHQLNTTETLTEFTRAHFTAMDARNTGADTETISSSIVGPLSYYSTMIYDGLARGATNTYTTVTGSFTNRWDEEAERKKAAAREIERKNRREAQTNKLPTEYQRELMHHNSSTQHMNMTKDELIMNRLRLVVERDCSNTRDYLTRAGEEGPPPRFSSIDD